MDGKTGVAPTADLRLPTVAEFDTDLGLQPIREEICRPTRYRYGSDEQSAFLPVSPAPRDRTEKSGFRNRKSCPRLEHSMSLPPDRRKIVGEDIGNRLKNEITGEVDAIAERLSYVALVWSRR